MNDALAPFLVGAPLVGGAIALVIAFFERFVHDDQKSFADGLHQALRAQNEQLSGPFVVVVAPGRTEVRVMARDNLSGHPLVSLAISRRGAWASLAPSNLPLPAMRIAPDDIIDVEAATHLVIGLCQKAEAMRQRVDVRGQGTLGSPVAISI